MSVTCFFQDHIYLLSEKKIKGLACGLFMVYISYAIIIWWIGGYIVSILKMR